MKNREIEDGRHSESDSDPQEFGVPHSSMQLHGDTPGKSRRTQRWLIGTLALVGLLAGWVAGGVKSTPLTAPTPALSISEASSEKAGLLDLLHAKQRTDVAEAQLAQALREEGNSSTVSIPTSGEVRVLALQEELIRAEAERDQRGPASEEETAATRHHEDLLRITYEAQLATLSPAEQKRTTVRLLRREAVLAGSNYQQLKAHQADSNAQTEILKRRQTSIAGHALLARRTAAGVFGVFIGGFLGFLLSRNQKSTLEEQSGNILSRASAGRFRVDAAIAEQRLATGDPVSDRPLHGAIPAVAIASPEVAHAGNQASVGGASQRRKALFETRWRGRLGPLEEACRDAIYSILLADWGKGIRSYAVVSADKGDGKTTVTANMAMALARAGLRVVMVDASTDQAKLHEIFFVGNGFGLLNVLRGELDLDRAPIDAFVSRTWLSNVALVTAGTTELEPAELIQPFRFKVLIDRLTAAFDLVLVDVSSDRSTDMANATTKCCGGIVVLLRDDGPNDAVSTLYDNLANSGAYVAGTILNHLPDTAAGGPRLNHANDAAFTVSQDREITNAHER